MAREMKNCGIEWIGEIPANWEITKHKYVMYKVKDICDKYNNEDILSLTMGGVIKRDLDNPTGKMPASFDGYQRVYTGNLLMCLFDIDVTPRCIGYIRDNGLTSPAYSQYVVNKGNAQYYDYLLRMIDDNKCFLHLSKNLRSSLTDENFGAILTVAPPEEEQQKIVEFLDEKIPEIDKMIAETKSSIESYKEYKQSIITEAVTKGLNKNVQMKDSGIEWIGEIPVNWEIMPLKYKCILNEETLTENTDPNYEFMYVEIGSVSLEKGISKYEKMIFENSPSRARRVVRKNDVIISTVRTYLKAIAVIPDMENIIVSTGFAVIKPKNISSKYLGYMLKTDYFTNSVSAKSVGVSYPAINASDLIQFKILVPSLKEQEEIAEYLDNKMPQIDNLISEKEALVYNLEEYKKSLIYEYVTGKKAVL